MEKMPISAKIIKEKILENFLGYVNIFTPVQSNFLSDLQKKYHCLDSASIVLYYAKKTHQAILRKKEYNLNYDLSLEKFWYNHSKADLEYSTILEIAKSTSIPKETTRRKLVKLIKEKVFIKKNKNIYWFPNDEYKIIFNEVVNREIRQLAKLTKYVTDKTDLNFSIEEIQNEYKNNFSFYWFHYLDLQLKWLKLWKKQFQDTEMILIFLHIATLLASKIKEQVSHEELFSKPDIVNRPKSKNINISISATSLSDITGIPRATCIRKLNQMVDKKMLLQDKISKRYYIIPEALDKGIVSKELTAEVTRLFGEFYFIIINAINSKNND